MKNNSNIFKRAMMHTPTIGLTLGLALVLPNLTSCGSDAVAEATDVPDQVIAEQRAALALATDGKGYGPQAPRDIDAVEGMNMRLFAIAPNSAEMNLCNIHFHKYAEHKGGEFSTYVGNGDGEGYKTGYKYSGSLTEAELEDSKGPVCEGKHGGVSAGDTIEVHYVHTSSGVMPGPTLGACLNEAINNPSLRVEAQVFVVVNDESAEDFSAMMEVGQNAKGYYQAANLPGTNGDAVEYTGSTTGPSYNEKGSPFQVTWNVRRQVIKVDIATVGEWCKDNTFDEDHAHAVRNLVTNPELLSVISQ